MPLSFDVACERHAPTQCARARRPACDGANRIDFVRHANHGTVAWPVADALLRRAQGRSLARRGAAETGGNHAHILARRPCPAGRPHQPAPRCHACRPGAAVRRGQAPPHQGRLRQFGAGRVRKRAARGDRRPRGRRCRLSARADEHRHEDLRDERRPRQRRERDRLCRKPYRGKGWRLGLRPQRDEGDCRRLQRGRRSL
jgi:hypothetical protein